MHSDPEEEKTADIVDGQQRLITLTLILHALGIKNEKEIPLLGKEFNSNTSTKNIQKNHKFIQHYIDRKWKKENHDQYRDFILNHCTIVVITLHDLDEAFQLFDSQNARGRPLEPYDLLKAYHLREMNDNIIGEECKRTYVRRWEAAASREPGETMPMTLKSLVGLHLYRIRRWSVGLKAGEFTKDQIDAFKGVNIGKHDYRYVRPFRELDVLCDSREHRIDEPIINGRWFFEYILHYLDMSDQLFTGKSSILGDQKTGCKTDIYKAVMDAGHYHGWWRTGDGYVRSLFKSALLHYYDKFGPTNLDQAAESIFHWACSLRITYNSIHKQRIEKHALAVDDGDQTINSSAFRLINISVHPSQFIEGLNEQTDKLKAKNRSNVKGVDQLLNLFPNGWEKTNDQ